MSKSFKQMSERVQGSASIYDALNLGFRWKHQGVFTFADDYMRTVESIANSYKTEKILIAADYGGSSYRKGIYPEYKANREALKASQTEKEADDFKRFMDEMQRTLELLRNYYEVFQYKGVEADDIAAFIVGKREELGLSNIWLISGDGDWDLLISEFVSRFSTASRKEVTLENWSTHYEYAPEDHISVKCLMGDSGDNVPGVPKIGPKTAHKLIKQYGTTFDIIASLPLAGSYQYIRNLNAFGADALMLNYQLMDLPTHCEEAIGPENCADIIARLSK